MRGGKRDNCAVRCRSALRVFSLLLFLLLCCFVMPVRANNGGVAVQLPSNREECFFEEVTSVGVKVFLHFTVTSGGSLDIDTTIYSPDKSVIWMSTRESEGRVLFKSQIPGRHYFCFSNKMSSVTTKVVLFSIIVGEDSSSKEHSTHGMDSLERAIMRIQQGLLEIRDVQWYLRRRERVHRATTEVANTRIFFWSALQIIMIAFLGVAHVWYIKRLLNKRRVV